MSRRIPKTQAEKALEKCWTDYPWFRRFRGRDDVSNEEIMAVAPEIERSGLLAGVDPEMAEGFALLVCGFMARAIRLERAWQGSRHVFRLDPDLASEISRSYCPRDTPLSELYLYFGHHPLRKHNTHQPLCKGVRNWRSTQTSTAGRPSTTCSPAAGP